MLEKQQRCCSRTTDSQPRVFQSSSIGLGTSSSQNAILACNPGSRDTAQSRSREGGQRMGEKRAGSRWGPQHPHKHPPPTMLAQVWGCSSPFPAARDQPKGRGKSQGSLIASQVSSLSSSNRHRTDHARLRRGGKTRMGQGSLQGDPSTVDLLFYKLQGAFLGWYHDAAGEHGPLLGPCPHTKPSEGGGQEVPAGA